MQKGKWWHRFTPTYTALQHKKKSRSDECPEQFMSILPIALPAAAALPAIGLALLAAVLIAFKPLLIGLLRAALLLVRPRPSFEQRCARRILQSILIINHMARELDASQPALAAELRSLAARS
jgi:hypothetical protein